MSLKEAGTAAQGIDVPQGEASASSSPHGISFVKSIDRKARSYLKTLERSFTFSTTESKGEDPSTMTIEFLRARLQAQRADYKAEKQRSQLLAKKVMELEQRLSFEIEQRRKAESNNMHAISPNYRRGSSSRLKVSHSYNGRGFKDSKLKDNSSGEDDFLDRCSEISGSEGGPDGDGVFPIPPASLRHHWESLRRERQQKVNQHVVSQLNDGINTTSTLDKKSFTLNHRDMPSEAMNCGEYALSVEELEGIVDREKAKSHVVSIECEQEYGLEAWNKSYGPDPQSLRVSSMFVVPAVGYERPLEAQHNYLHDSPNKQASTSHDAEDESFKFDTRATKHDLSNYFASSFDSFQNYQLKFSQFPIDSLNKMVSSKFSPRRGVHVSAESNAKGPEFGIAKTTNFLRESKSTPVREDGISKYIAAPFNTTQKTQDKVLNDESTSEYMKEIFSPEGVFELSRPQQSSQEVRLQKTNVTFKTCRSFSALETRYGRALQGHRRSLDGGLDRLQKVGKDICRAREDGANQRLHGSH